MYRISKRFYFSASHTLNGLSEKHPCARVHGHNYVMIVELGSSSLDDVGMIVDYRELDFIKKYIDETFDHRHLNDVVPFNPTAENLAKYFYDWIRSKGVPLVCVTMKETPKTSAKYYDVKDLRWIESRP